MTLYIYTLSSTPLEGTSITVPVIVLCSHCVRILSGLNTKVKTESNIYIEQSISISLVAIH